MDIKPPKNWKQTTQVSKPIPSKPKPVVKHEPPKVDVEPGKNLLLGDIQLEPSEDNSYLRQKSHRQKFGWKRVLLIFAGFFVLVAGLAVTWCLWQISPVNNDATKQEFVVIPGERPATIAKNLEKKGLIRSALAFEIYARLQGQADNLKAGSYRLAANQSVADILGILKKGQDGVYNFFIPPGLTLKQLADPKVKGSFAAQGFSDSEIKEAFSSTYTSPLLKDKPSEATLEGYIFPETFQVKTGDSLESILERSFNELYYRLDRDGLLKKFTEKGLSLHQALTLGSIVQEETSDSTAQPQVAQVFLSRLNIGMSLGSDVTFIYAARQLGVTPTPELDSPYNTRIHTGLPPGPIATMNYSALQAIANPASGDYLFFVAGDDGGIHYSHTDAEHQQKVRQYCQKLCSATL